MTSTSRAIALALMMFSAATVGASQDAGQANYVIGPQDVLEITSYDQPDLSGMFAVERDGTFSFPLIGRVNVGGRTVGEFEGDLRQQLIALGFFKNPQIRVAIEQYESQKIYVVGEVRTPGVYPLTGDMRLAEALALAGSMLPTASGEAIIVHSAKEPATAPPSVSTNADPPDPGPEEVTRVDLRELTNGAFSENVALRDGDTVFVLRAENVYVFGQVRDPGAYPLQLKNTTVLQALTLAGGLTDRAATSRVQVVRSVNGDQQEIRVKLTDFVRPGDTIVVPERYF